MAEIALPDVLPVLPLRETVVFPLAMAPLAVGQPRSVRLVDDVMRGNRLLALVAQRGTGEQPGPDDLHRVGTFALIHQLSRASDGTLHILVQGLERIRVLDFVSTDPYLVARVQAAPEQPGVGVEADALRQAAVDLFRRLVALTRELPDDVAVAAASLPD